MKTKSVRSFVFEGLQQAGLVLTALVLLGTASWFAAICSPKFEVLRMVCGLAAGFATAVVIGPVPVFLTSFDITNKALLVWTAILLIPYWACLGTAAGFWRWLTSDPDSQPLITGFWVWLKGNPEANQREAISPWKNKRRTRVAVEILAIILAVIISPCWPGYSHNRSSVKSQIMQNLREIELAKRIFFAEVQPPFDHIPTEMELAPYLTRGTNFFRFPTGPIHYVVNPADKQPYAVVDSDWRVPRRNWQEGYTLTNGTIIQLP